MYHFMRYRVLAADVYKDASAHLSRLFVAVTPIYMKYAANGFQVPVKALYITSHHLLHSNDVWTTLCG